MSIEYFQASISEKVREKEILEEKYMEANMSLQMQQEEFEKLKNQYSHLQGEADSLNKSLFSKDDLVSSLNVTIANKSEEVRGLYKSLEERNQCLSALEERVQFLEETEEKLVYEKDQAADQLSLLKDTLNFTKEKLNMLETTHKDETAAEISKYTSEYEEELASINDKNQTLLDEVSLWKNKFEALEKMIEPFREQLDAYEVERAGLVSSNLSAKDELVKLSDQYAKLLGHSNHKQKIHHVLKLKTENTKFKDEIQKLRLEIERQRKTVKRLEEKLDKQCGKSRLNDSKFVGDKENISKSNDKVSGEKEFLKPLTCNTSISEPLTASTPVRSNKKPQRL